MGMVANLPDGDRGIVCNKVSKWIFNKLKCWLRYTCIYAEVLEDMIMFIGKKCSLEFSQNLLL